MAHLVTWPSSRWTLHPSTREPQPPTLEAERILTCSSAGWHTRCDSRERALKQTTHTLEGDPEWRRGQIQFLLPFLPSGSEGPRAAFSLMFENCRAEVSQKHLNFFVGVPVCPLGCQQPPVVST